MSARIFKSFENYIYDILCQVNYDDLRPTPMDESSGQIFSDQKILFSKLKVIFEENIVYWDMCESSGKQEKYAFSIKTKKYDMNDKDITIDFSFDDGDIFISWSNFDSKKNIIKVKCKKIWLDHMVLYESIKKIFLDSGFYGNERID